MEVDYNIVKITTEEALKKTLLCFSDNVYFVYRGQANCSWTLQTSLERNVNALKLSSFTINKYESKIVKDYKNDIEKDLSPIEIIINIQHYGGTTRLIDFTHDYAIALFFAFCDFPKDCSTVWAISKNYLPFIGDYQFREHNGELNLFEIDFQRQYEEERVFDFYIEEFIYSDITNINEFINEKMKNYPEEMQEYKLGALDILSSKELEFNLEYQTKSGLKAENPKQISSQEKFVQESLKNYFKSIKNQRLLNQRGLSLFSSNLNYTFEENIFFGKTMKEIEEGVIKIVNPEIDQLNSIRSKAYRSQRGIIKFEINSSLTKFILNILRKGSYELVLPSMWNNSEDYETETFNIGRGSITFKTMYPDRAGYYRDLTHMILE